MCLPPGELLLGQFRFELLLFFDYVVPVADRVHEGIPTAGLQLRIFVFEPVVGAVGAEEDVAG